VSRRLRVIRKTKIFDPADGSGALKNAGEVTDCTLAERDGRWWMYLAGSVVGSPGIHLFSASLPDGAPLSANGWNLTPDAADMSKIGLLGSQVASAPWDLKGGRHCPSYVKGWDPDRGAWVERIYYAGGAEQVWGPYTIGYLQWDGSNWIHQPSPAFTANEDWEHGSVYEPNLIYADGKWKMWYVSGSNHENYLAHGFAESPNGRDQWSRHEVFAPPEMKMFDFRAIPTQQGYEAVFSRVWLGGSDAPPETGLWWCRCDHPSRKLADWGEPIQIIGAENCGWHSGPWRPAVSYSDSDPKRMFVFFDGIYKTNDPGPFPFVFTLGCLEMEWIEE